MNNQRPAIAVLTNDPGAVFQQQVISGAREILEARGFDMTIWRELSAPSAEHGYPFDPFTVKGMLVLANIAEDNTLRALWERNVPISLVSHVIPGTNIPSVLSNNEQGINKLVKHLVERCGRQRIIYVRGIADQEDAIRRENAFRRALVRHNLDVESMVFVEGEFAPETASASIRTLLEQGVAFDAVLAADYPMAIEAVNTLRAHGISVPQQVSFLVLPWPDAASSRDCVP